MKKNRWQLLALGAAALTFASLLLLRPGQPTPAALGAPPWATDLGGAQSPACIDSDLAPGPLLPGLDTAPLVLVGAPAMRFYVDGQAIFSPVAEPHRFPAGARTLRVQAEGAASAEITVRLDAFRPGLVLGLRDGETLLLLPLEVPCVSCEHSGSALDLRFDGSRADQAPAAAARALSTGQWRSATELLRSVPEPRRDRSFRLRVAAAEALAGQPTSARRRLRAESGEVLDLWRSADAALGELTNREQVLRAQVAVKRWNAVTERTSRLTDAFGFAAAGSVAKASSRLDALSRSFAKSAEGTDASEQEATVRAAFDVLAALVRELRAARPADCAWQSRVTTSQ